MTKINESLDQLIANTVSGEATVDFKKIEQATLSSQYGSVSLVICDKNNSLQIIKEAEEHFNSCLKNTLNCKSL